ncbi:Longitudinals lacking protein, isoforms A/B/D/L [Papilio machaon]|uniref:Longitudinals lacking protein, isoforms A/B/D/L n=2 Tax=Papilio TaxID=7145 RepID=A0A194Q9J5_PAPXU|nr:Longitudinals lacking protein, isoforms A/B/D/L [Papilio xuthus]KPJ07438.1 Longitudinals lacking protein, isoforms A/B/D/L [Papilio machaon]
MMQNMLPIVPMKTKNYWSRYETSFECEKCKRKYRHKSTYRRHVTYECGKEPMFRCPFLECTYKAYQKTHTDAHIKTKHKVTALEYKR